MRTKFCSETLRGENTWEIKHTCEYNTKMGLKIGLQCWLDSNGSEQVRVTGSCEYGNEHFSSINGWEFLGQFSSYQFLKKDCFMELYIPWYNVCFVIIYGTAGKNSDVNASQFPIKLPLRRNWHKVIHTHTCTQKKCLMHMKKSATDTFTLIAIIWSFNYKHLQPLQF